MTRAGGSVRLFVLGPPCSGKTTLVPILRSLRPSWAVVEMDDEVLRLNDGVWPDIETKNNVILPQAIAGISTKPNAVFLNSYMTTEGAQSLRAHGFRTALLHVAEPELRRRDAHRLAVEGWSNFEWFDWHQENIAELRAAGFVDYEVSAEQKPGVVAADILQLADRTAASPD